MSRGRSISSSAAILIVVISALHTTSAQSAPSLLWQEDPSSMVTGFAVTVDGARTDYGDAPLASDGTCNCRLALPFTNGRHTLTVAAYNSYGETAAAPFVIGPTAAAAGPYSGQAGTPLIVDAAATSDAFFSITSFAWNWGDGTPDTTVGSPTTSHTYAAAGTFTITLTVTDDFPASHTATTTATIVAAPPPPPGVPSSPSPLPNETDVAVTRTLTWSSTGATSYDVQFGITNPPPLVASGVTSASFAPPALSTSATYYWQITAANATGTAIGPVWSFATTASPPGVPESPSPSPGESNVAVTRTLTWSAADATRYDVQFGTTNPPSLVASAITTSSFAPALSPATTYFWQITATNAGGSTAGPVWSFTTASEADAPDVVIYTGEIPPAAVHGSWTALSDPTAAGGTKLVSSDLGFAATSAPLAAPIDFVDVVFDAPAGVPYTLWLRMRALGNNKYNDSLWIQFSDALSGGEPVYSLDSTEGLLVNLATDQTAASLNAWGWQHGAYWLSQPTTVTFASSGPHTLRIQVREDGVQLDQIVLSAAQYLNRAPGSVSNDSTIVPKPSASAEVVIYASDVPGIAMHGSWTATSDATSPNGIKLVTTDAGSIATTALSAPTDFVDARFLADAGVPYTIWIRIAAANNDVLSDSLWIQFSDAWVNAAHVYPLDSSEALLVNGSDASNTLNGWGWSNGAYWLSQPATIVFANSGAHTIRIQIREDGIQFDQIVLSPSRYLNRAPGLPAGDTTIISK